MVLTRLLLAASLVLQAQAQRVITTVAGTDWLFPGDGRQAKDAPIGGIEGLDLALDKGGNLYIADSANNIVFRVTPDGVLRSYAGNGLKFTSGDGGLAVNAGLDYPTAIAVDNQGNLYIAEYGSHIRKVTPDGVITTIAGTNVAGYSGDGGPANQAELNIPYGLATDSAGNLYVSDTANNRIRKITPGGVITTIAGTGEASSAGDGIAATKAAVFKPLRITADSAGNLYFTESIDINVVPSPKVRKIDANGVITTIAGGGSDFSDGIPATKAVVLPIGITADPAGNVYVTDAISVSIRKVDTKGIITIIAGGTFAEGPAVDSVPATQAQFRFGVYSGLSFSATGVLYLADSSNERVRTLTPDGLVNIAVGNGQYRFSGDGGPATSATLDLPVSVLGDANGNLFVSEPPRNRIRKIAPDGTISVYAGNHGGAFSGDGGQAANAALFFPWQLAFAPDGSLTFADSLNNVIRSISPSGIIHTIAGNSQNTGYTGDGGLPLNATFRAPQGVAYDGAGDLIISDSQNHAIRAVLAPPDGRIFTLAGGRTADGNGIPGDSGDGKLSTQALVNRPDGVRVFNNAIYFADANNNKIRKIDIATLIITTVAGNGTAGYSGDGGKATAAQLRSPQSVSFDSSGNMYIADAGNQVVRMVAPLGIISTIAGSASSATLGDGGLALNAQIGAPADVFVDPAGKLFIADQFFNRIRAVLVNPPSFALSASNLAFTAAAGASSQDQRVDLTGTIPGIPYAITSSAAWLQATPAVGNMPSSLKVTADPSTMTPGSYQGTLTVQAPTASPATSSISVALTVTAPGQPTLSAKPSALTAYSVINAPAVERVLTVSNLGGGAISFNVKTSAPWLTLSSASGSVGAFASSTIVATLNPSKLGPGAYSDAITVSSTSPAQSVTIPVTMTVTQVEQSILIPQSGLTFYAVQGGGAPPPQVFSILNTGRGQMPFTTKASTLTAGPNWLIASPSGGSTSSTAPLQGRVDIDPTGLKAGVYYGTVAVIAPTAVNTPQFVSVVLNVLAPGNSVGPIVTPAGMLYAASANGESPASQTLSIQSTSSTPVAFTSVAVTTNGGNWITMLPASGTVTQAQPMRVIVQPNVAGLAGGVYRGSITFSFSDGSVRSMSVALVLVPGGNASIARAGREAARDTACIPKSLAPVFTQIPSGVPSAVGFPSQIGVKVVDDCGQPMTTGDAVASFSNGDAPLALFSLLDGNWVATWIPQHPSSSVTVTADVSNPDLNLKAEIKQNTSAQSNDATPIVGSGGIVNGASFAAQAPLAPGSFVTLFGAALAQGSTSASSVPLPTTLGGATVLLAGQEVPIFFAKDNQLNAILPYGLPVNTTQQMFVSRGSGLSVPQGITLAAAAPGVFTTDGKQGIIINGSAIADATNPAKTGDTLVIYCTGLGEVNPAVKAGTQTPNILAQITNSIAVTIGGVPAQSIPFAGLTPGQTGLYQINVVVPAGIAAGNQVPVVVTVANASSVPVTMAVK
jgi:uncharacterized protein (TIGR03437 family)